MFVCGHLIPYKDDPLWQPHMWFQSASFNIPVVSICTYRNTFYLLICITGLHSWFKWNDRIKQIRSSGIGTAGIHITLLVGLSSVEAAIMDEGIKQMELEDIHLLIKHEIQTVIEYKLLDNKAEEGQWFQKESLRAEKHSPTA